MFGAAVPVVLQDLLFDPQTSGGLLISVPADQADAILQDMQAEISVAACIGKVSNKGKGNINVN